LIDDAPDVPVVEGVPEAAPVVVVDFPVVVLGGVAALVVVTKGAVVVVVPAAVVVVVPVPVPVPLVVRVPEVLERQLVSVPVTVKGAL